MQRKAIQDSANMKHKAKQIQTLFAMHRARYERFNAY